MGCKDRSGLHTITVPGGAAGADGETAASSPEGLATSLMRRQTSLLSYFKKEQIYTIFPQPPPDQ